MRKLRVVNCQQAHVTSRAASSVLRFVALHKKGLPNSEVGVWFLARLSEQVEKAPTKGCIRAHFRGVQSLPAVQRDADQRPPFC